MLIVGKISLKWEKFHQTILEYLRSWNADDLTEQHDVVQYWLNQVQRKPWNHIISYHIRYQISYIMYHVISDHIISESHRRRSALGDICRAGMSSLNVDLRFSMLKKQLGVPRARPQVLPDVVRSGESAPLLLGQRHLLPSGLLYWSHAEPWILRSAAHVLMYCMIYLYLHLHILYIYVNIHYYMYI